MGTQAGAHKERKEDVGRAASAMLLLTVIAWVAGLALRIWAGRGLPLWIDETWTGMIASQPDWAGFWREAWLDVNPPLYYGLMAGWTKVAGLSDIALRLPSLLFLIAAAALPLCWRTLGLSRHARLCWSALLILWWPGFEISVDARGYALLLLLSTAQLLACGDAVAKGTLRSAFLWAGLASAAILTHYFALVPAGLQGLLLVWRHRTRLRALWPAAFAFAPAFGWLAYHAPRLAEYARPDVVWYSPVKAASAAAFVQYVVGAPGWGLVLVGLAALVTALLSRGEMASAKAIPTGARDLALVGGAAFALLLVIGVARATLTDRYFVPVVPSILLGLVLILSRYRKAALGQCLLLFAFLVPLASPQGLRARLVERTFYGFERASSFAMANGARHLTFVWDHPAAKVLDAGSLAKLGGFFFMRAGQDVATTALSLRPVDDGNILLPRAGRGGAIIWIYNRARTSSARFHPPMASRWPGWTCQHERGPWVGILTCVQVAKPGTGVKVAL